LTFGLSSYPPSLLPWNNTGTAAVTVKLLIFRGLLSYDGTGALRGELAQTWARDGDTGWVFHLRDAVFQNGAKVTADDVKWTLEQVGGGKILGLPAHRVPGVERIETPDAKTVRIVMKQPNVMLPEWLAGPHMPIIAKGSTENGGTAIGGRPVPVEGAGTRRVARPSWRSTNTTSPGCPS